MTAPRDIKTRRLPPFLQQELASPPTAGAGLHQWLFNVSRQLHHHMPAGEIAQLLYDRTQGCGRPVPPREICDAVQNSARCAWRPGHLSRPRQQSPPIPHPAVQQEPTWPAVDEDLRKSIVAGGYTLTDAWECSPVRMDEDGPDVEEIIDLLFPANPLLCVGLSQHEFETRSREDFRGCLARKAFIVPSPMSKVYGRRKSDGQMSQHTLDNTGTRRFLVVEFDNGSLDEQAAILNQLSNRAPLVMVVHWGGKSLHGWFKAHPHEAVTRTFFTLAVKLGADPRMWTPSQFARLPEGCRESGRIQRVFFLNPAILL